MHQDWQKYFTSYQPTSSTSPSDSAQLDKNISLALNASVLIRYYKARGHEMAKLDPLSKLLIKIRIVKFFRVWQSVCEAST